MIRAGPRVRYADSRVDDGSGRARRSDKSEDPRYDEIVANASRARGIPVAQTPALTEETLFVLVDDALIGLGVTSGATIEEASEALRRLEATGYRIAVFAVIAYDVDGLENELRREAPIGCG